MRGQIKRVPVLGAIAQRLYAQVKGTRSKTASFPGSQPYWERRYASGGTSGAGSYGRLAEFKAEIINGFVREHGVQSVIDFGCGDGNQLALAAYPAYLGLDVSETAISLCKKKFGSDTSKTFKLMQRYGGETADLALSLDVIYHLTEDEVFENYMRTLFGAAARYVIVYANDSDQNTGYSAHVKCRKFTRWIGSNLPDWALIEHVPNRYPYQGDEKAGSFADFYIYEKTPRLEPGDTAKQ